MGISMVNSCFIKQEYRNVVKCSSGKAESEKHRLVKFWIANFCWSHDLTFSTEVIFTDNSRADILIKEWGVIFEVLSSEKFNDFKKKSYPFPAVAVKTQNSEQKVWNMLSDLYSIKGQGFEHYQKKEGLL